MPTNSDGTFTLCSGGTQRGQGAGHNSCTEVHAANVANRATTFMGSVVMITDIEQFLAREG